MPLGESGDEGTVVLGGVAGGSFIRMQQNSELSILRLRFFVDVFPFSDGGNVASCSSSLLTCVIMDVLSI